MLSQICIKLVPRMLKRNKLAKNEVPFLMKNWLIAVNLNIKLLLSELVILETMKVLSLKLWWNLKVGMMNINAMQNS